jgi:hypothetical protein
MTLGAKRRLPILCFRRVWSSDEMRLQRHAALSSWRKVDTRVSISNDWLPQPGRREALS